MNPATLQLILKLLDILAVGLAEAPEALARFTTVKSAIDRMVAEGRNPTREEFEALMNDTDTLTDRLDAADDKLNPDEEEASEDEASEGGADDEGGTEDETSGEGSGEGQ